MSATIAPTPTYTVASLLSEFPSRDAGYPFRMASIDTEDCVRTEPEDEAVPRPVDEDDDDRPRCSCEGGLVRL